MSHVNVREEVGRGLVNVHYLLHSYVCGQGCVRPTPFEGWATFTQIFQQCPDACRFAVAKIAADLPYQPQGPYVCWDFHDDTLTNPTGGTVTAPWPKWQGPSADGLIMKAMALYDRD